MDNSAFPEATLGNEAMLEEIQKSLFEYDAQITKISYNAAVEHDSNTFFSPLSDYIAFAVLYLGTDGTTRREFLAIDDEQSDNERVQQGHELLRQILHHIRNSNDTEIRIGHAIFAPKHVKLLESFVNRVRSHYQVQILNVDFVNEPSFATYKINHFVWERTSGEISKLFDLPLSSDTNIVLTHYSCINASWANPFDVRSTKEENFHTLSGTCTTNMMTQRGYIPYINMDDVQAEAIGLPYEGDETSMFFVLPRHKQTLNNVISLLEADHFQRIVQQSQKAYVHIKIPRIKYKWSNDISDSLKELGIEEIFTENAKLHNMVKQDNSNVPPSLSKLVHAAEIEIHEQGTGAVPSKAITADCHNQYSENFEPTLFHANRPFLLFVYNHSIGTILFVGTVQNPNATAYEPAAR